MKELKHLNSLLEDLKTSNYKDIADKLEKSASSIYKKSSDEDKEVKEEVSKSTETNISAEEDVIEKIQEVFAVLKSNLDMSLVSHWISKKEQFYGDHLLFKRLYDENFEELDSFVEKFIPLTGESFLNPVKVNELNFEFMKNILDVESNEDFINKFESPESFCKKMWIIEKLVIKHITELYDFLKEKNILTLGQDDFLMSSASEHESHIYLLGQRIA